MKKLIVICGPTATGKTSLALTIAEKFNGEVVSADSRQVYKGLTIGTGKDLPPGSKINYPDREFERENIGYYNFGSIKLWGYDLTEPSLEFSVSHYRAKALKILNRIYSDAKIPVLTGGTGLYIKSITDGIATVDVPLDRDLRAELAGKSAVELFEILNASDPVRAGQMNNSDRFNPRRLIRALEIERNSNKAEISRDKAQFNVLFIGLKADKNVLKDRIIKRVASRMDDGLENEIKVLINNGLRFGMQSMNTLGYKEWNDFFEGKCAIQEVIEKWTNNEVRYAKRQMTWFNKDKRINWFDVTEGGWKDNVENLIQKWQNEYRE